ncbi:MAG TPA: GNAT family N-acetyltransferase [Acidimicrobiales bacterium]|jgi:predicted acetyltransferase|nr:GNAT family N-acetyltransferase [Acidimicrobiales bacterium]
MTPTEPVLRHPESDDEVERCFDLVHRAFNFPRDDVERFKGETDRDRALAVFVGDEAAAFSRIRPFGQFFGGRSVPMAGYSPVGAAPEFRGRGFGSMVTAGHYADLRDRGEVVAALYPATTALYKGVGFGIGGVWGEHTVPARSLQTLRPPGGVVVRRGTEADIPAVKALYRQDAARHDGHLDRPDVWWDGRLFREFDKVHLYVVDGEHPGALAGYTRYTHESRRDWGYTVVVQDLVAPDADVALALWRLVGSSSTLSPEVRVVGPPEHPLLLTLPEQDLEPRQALRWMVRLVDMAGAFGARGYAADRRAAVDLDIDDGHCPWNAGRHRLVIQDGEGRLEKGGSGTIKATPTALASLYTGYATAQALRTAGHLTGASEAALTMLTNVFAAPTPWMADFF